MKVFTRDIVSQAARSPQRVARAGHKPHSRLHFAHSTRTISAEGCAHTGQIALSPAFRALDAHDLRRGLRAHRANRTLACVSRTRHAQSPQRVARTGDKSHSRLHFAHWTRTISAEGCAHRGQKSHSCLHSAHSTRAIFAEGRAHRGQIALSPALRALDTHDLRRGLRANRTNRTLACILFPRHARSPQGAAFSVDAVRRTQRKFIKWGNFFSMAFIRTSPVKAFHTQYSLLHTCPGLHLHTFALGYLHLHTCPWMLSLTHTYTLGYTSVPLCI